MDLSDEITRVLRDCGLSDGWQGGEQEIAERILAIPKLVEALAALDREESYSSIYDGND